MRSYKASNDVERDAIFMILTTLNPDNTIYAEPSGTGHKITVFDEGEFMEYASKSPEKRTPGADIRESE